MANKIHNFDFQKAFITQIRKLINKAGIKQTDLAKAIKLTDNSLSDWLNDKKQPYWVTQVYILMKYFLENIDGFNPWQLFWEDCPTSNMPSTELEKTINKIKTDYEKKLILETNKIKSDYEKQIKKMEKAHEKILSATNSQATILIKEENSYLKQKLRMEKINSKKNSENHKKTKDKLEKELEDLKKNITILTCADLSEEELKDLSYTVAIGNLKDQYAKERIRKLLTSPKLLKLIATSFKEPWSTLVDSENEADKFYRSVGFEFVYIIKQLRPSINSIYHGRNLK